ncbi:MAG: hypothetical protein V4722_03215 [Bacteroidota bacterium]
MNENYLHQKNRRNLAILLFTVFVAFAVIKYWITPSELPKIDEKAYFDWIAFWSPIFDTLIGSCFLGAGLAFWAYFKKPAEEMFEILNGKPKIDEALLNAIKGTKIWKFSGGTGSNTRQKIIPLLSRRSQQVKVTLQILDPEDKGLCEKYSSYRNAYKRGAEKLTAEQVKLHVYATIIQCIYYQNFVENLEFYVYLKNSYSALRYDISTTNLVITQEDKKAPAYLVKNHSSFFIAVETEFETTKEASKLLDIAKCSAVIASTQLYPNDLSLKVVNDAFHCVQLPAVLTDADLTYIIPLLKTKD